LVRILFTRFPLESAMGGAEIQTLSLMEGLRERGHEISFLGSCPVMLEECAKRKIPHAKLEIGLPPVTKFGAISFAWRKGTMAAKLRAALSGFPGVDVVVMMSLSEKLLLTRVLAKRTIRVFWLEHDRIGRWLRKNPWLRPLKKESEYATTICVSELSKNMYASLGWSMQKTVAIPNGINLDRFPSTKREPANHGVRFGCVARLSQEKGVDVLIQAAGTLPEIDVEIVGIGPDEGYLRKMIDAVHEREHAAEPRIVLRPRVENLGNFYASLDVLVLPSRDHDPFGLVAAEAMSMGIPVIVTDACGIADYVRDGEEALVAKADSAASLTEAMQKMLNPERRARIGENGKRAAHDQFGLPRMIEAYETLFSKK
jgi:glycosyltransferase involved in cell wall biosynthesis